MHGFLILRNHSRHPGNDARHIGARTVVTWFHLDMFSFTNYCSLFAWPDVENPRKEETKKGTQRK